MPAVAAPRCDEVFAVVQDAGLWTHSVFRSRDEGASWVTVNEGLTGHPINDLTTDEEDTRTRPARPVPFNGRTMNGTRLDQPTSPSPAWLLLHGEMRSPLPDGWGCLGRVRAASPGANC